MKQGLRFILPVQVDIDLNTVSSIRFKFSQERADAQLIFDYPSDKAKRVGTSNVINLEWMPKDTYEFISNNTMRMDTYITMSNTVYNPETEIIDLVLNPTLFTKAEVADDEEDEP